MHFFGGFFQLGYVTRNLDLACRLYAERFGAVPLTISEPAPINGKQPPTRRLALAWIDDVMTEIIEPDPAQKTIYDDAIPQQDGAICLHHFGYLIDDYTAMLQRLRQMGYAVPFHGTMPGAMNYIYADTRADLGHFCEFIELEDGGRAFFETVPRLRSR